MEDIEAADAAFENDVSAMAGTEKVLRFERLRDMALEGIDHYRPIWEEQNLCFDYYAGRQWSANDTAALQRQLRPVITFNRIGPVIDSITGLEINNREKAAVFPRLLGKAKQSELFSSGLEWLRSKANAEAEEADAFMDLAATGYGWTDTYLKAADKAPGRYDVGVDRVCPTECAMDPHAKKRNGKDTRYRVRCRSIPIEAARELFPDEEDVMLHAGWANVIDDNVNAYKPETERYFFTNAENVRARKQVTIVEVQWWEKAPYYEVHDPFRDIIVHMDKAMYDKANKRFALIRPGDKLQAVRYTRKVHRRAFLGAKILAEPPLPCPYDFSLQVMTGKRDKTRRAWFGLVRAMVDPQMWANKWLSQILHILNSNSKGGVLASKDTFEDWKKVEKNWNNPQYIAWLANGKAPEQIGYRQQTQFPQGLFELLNFSISSVRDASGFSLEMLGMADRDQPASLEWQRKQSGMTVLAIFFNALRMYRKDQAEYTLYMMQKWCADGRLIRVTIDAGEEQYIPLVLDQDVGVIEYDMVVDESPSSPNQKEAVWSMLMQAMPLLQSIQIPPQLWTELLKYSPLPTSVLSKMQELSKPDESGQQSQQIMQKLSMALMQAQADQLKGQAAESAADVVAKQAKAAKDMSDAKGIDLDNAIKRTTAGMAALGLQPPGGESAPGAMPAPPAPPQMGA